MQKKKHYEDWYITEIKKNIFEEKCQGGNQIRL